jgi:hypothetical protein
MWWTDAARSDDGEWELLLYVCTATDGRSSAVTEAWTSGGLPCRVVANRTRTPRVSQKRDTLQTHGVKRVGGRQMRQSSRLQAERQSWEQETHPNE